MPTTIDGLVTGLDTTKIIEGLTAVFQRRIDLLQSQRDKLTSQQTAFKSIEARLLGLQSAASQLGRTQNGVFDIKKVTSSNKDLVTAAASANATPGAYSLRVNNLATAHQITTQGFDDPNSLITQGTLQIKVGTGATTTITIGTTNNTLQGLADAINNAGADVTATILNDGTNSLTDNRLVLTSKKTGAANTITVTNSLAGDSDGAVRPKLNEPQIDPVIYGSPWTGTSPVTSGGTYSGPDNDTYTFTVSTGGTVGVNNGIKVNYADGSGTNSGQLSVTIASSNVFLNVAEGLQVKFAPGTLVTGQTFTVKVWNVAPSVQAAADASITVGSGAGAITIQSASNNLDNFINGATVNLLGADPTKNVQLTIDNDTAQAKDAVLDFVDNFNGLMEYIDEQVRFDSESAVAGLLLGNRSATSIQDGVRSAVAQAVAGVNGQMNRLGALGITTNSDGRLDVNQSKLDDALAGRISGVTVDDVRRLFALAAKSTSGNVQFVTGSIRTKESTTPYQVDISQAAERGSITGTNNVAASTVLTGSNNTLTFTVDGTLSSTITLATGTYTQQALAQELQAQINANSTLSGRKVSISVNNNKLVVTSDIYGLASQVKIGTGTALAPLGFVGTENDKGQDVVGKFIVNGVNESAVGTGQFLVGTATNKNTADLQVRITLTSSQVVAGAEASVTVTRGVASRLDVTLNSLLDPVIGRTKTIDDGLQDRVDDLDESIADQNELLQSRQESLLRQFVALESLVSQLKTTGDFFTSQLLSVQTQKRK